MATRLNYQQLPTVFDDPVKLSKEGSGIRHFMNDSRSEDEIRRIFQVINVKAVKHANPRLDTIEKSLLFGSPVKLLDHLFLKVDAYDSALGANHFRHGEAEKTHGAAHIHSCHSGSDVRGQMFHRIIKQFPQGICKQVSYPYGANVICQNPPPFS